MLAGFELTLTNERNLRSKKNKINFRVKLIKVCVIMCACAPCNSLYLIIIFHVAILYLCIMHKHIK